MRDQSVFTRREIALAVGALVLAMGSRRLLAKEFTDMDLLQMLVAEGDHGPADLSHEPALSTGPFLGRTARELEKLEAEKARALWWKMEENLRTPVTWAPDDRSIDFSHIHSYVSSPREFKLAPDALELLCNRNSFVLPAGGKVLFGLRGCEIQKGIEHAPWSDSHELAWTRPDHKDFRCVLGVWDRTKNQLSVFRGSTVPEVSLMHLCMLNLTRTNLLPTGLYQYAVGTHSGLVKQVGAFRQQGAVVALRTYNDLVYDPSPEVEFWADGSLGDNIHAAFPVPRTTVPLFSSAGCQVVSGAYIDGIPVGGWAAFRTAAGLAEISKGAEASPDDGKRFPYVLLTGLEACLASRKYAPFLKEYRRIRFGSTADTVKALQQQLKVTPTGRFDVDTSLTLLEQQFKKGEVQVPVVTVSG